MNTYTAEQIAAAARLVPERVRSLTIGTETYHMTACRDWQPWADTEAGSADWAVLDTAVGKWFAGAGKLYEYPPIIGSVWLDMGAAYESGDLAKRKAATMAAAIAIGQHFPLAGNMEQSNDN